MPKVAPVKPGLRVISADPRWIWAAGALIVLATFLAYLPAIHADYIWDDESYVTNNSLLRDLDGLKSIWIPKQTPQYYPMVFTMFWVEYHLWELRPMGYHLVNVLLHVCNALLVWRLAFMLGIPWGRSIPSKAHWIPGWLIALVFALHPVHVESVAWITERKNVLSGFFYLAAALAYLRFDQRQQDSMALQQKNEPWIWYGASVLLFALALLSKSVTCSLPAALILMMLWQRKPLTLMRLAPLIPMFIIGLVLALNTAQIEREHVGAEGPSFAFTFADRMLIASKALLFYPWKIIWPTNLIFVYPRWNIDDHDWRQYWSVGVVLFVAITLVALLVRGRRGLPLSLAFFAGTIFPALGFFNVYPMIFSFVADHFQYLASLGIIVAIVGSLSWLVKSQRLLIVIGAALTPLLGILTWTQTLMYSDIETLWLVTIERNEHAWMPRNNLSSHYLRQAELAQDAGDSQSLEHWAREAEVQSRAAVAIKPDHVSSWTNLSEALRLQKRYEESLAAARKSIEFRPDIAEHHWNAARVLQLLNQPQEAIVEYRRAIQLDTNYREAHVELSLLLLNDKRFDDALPHIEAVLAGPSPGVRFLLTVGQRLDQGGRFTEALKYYRLAYAAAQSGAEKADTGYFLLQLLAMCPDRTIRNGPEAVRIGEQIRDLSDRNKPLILGALAAAYAEANQFDDAIRTQEQALQAARITGNNVVIDELQRKLDAYRAGRTDP